MVRVDSGGTLVGVLLELGLIDELSLLVHPFVVGGSHHWYGASTAGLGLKLANTEVFEGDLLWLRYCIS